MTLQVPYCSDNPYSRSDLCWRYLEPGNHSSSSSSSYIEHHELSIDDSLTIWWWQDLSSEYTQIYVFFLLVLTLCSIPWLGYWYGLVRSSLVNHHLVENAHTKFAESVQKQMAKSEGDKEKKSDDDDKDNSDDDSKSSESDEEKDANDQGLRMCILLCCNIARGTLMCIWADKTSLLFLVSLYYLPIISWFFGYFSGLRRCITFVNLGFLLAGYYYGPDDFRDGHKFHFLATIMSPAATKESVSDKAAAADIVDIEEWRKYIQKLESRLSDRTCKTCQCRQLPSGPLPACQHISGHENAQINELNRTISQYSTNFQALTAENQILAEKLSRGVWPFEKEAARCERELEKAKEQFEIDRKEYVLSTSERMREERLLHERAMEEQAGVLEGVKRTCENELKEQKDTFAYEILTANALRQRAEMKLRACMGELEAVYKSTTEAMTTELESLKEKKAALEEKCNDLGDLADGEHEKVFEQLKKTAATLRDERDEALTEIDSFRGQLKRQEEAHSEENDKVRREAESKLNEVLERVEMESGRHEEEIGRWEEAAREAKIVHGKFVKRVSDLEELRRRDAEILKKWMMMKEECSK